MNRKEPFGQKPRDTDEDAEIERAKELRERLQKRVQYLSLLMLLVTGLLIALAGWSLWEARRVRVELAKIELAKVELQKREQELRDRLTSQQEQKDELHKKYQSVIAQLERLKTIEVLLQRPEYQSSFSTFTPITLTPAFLRSNSSGQTPLFSLNPSARLARFTVILDKDLIKNYPNTRAELSKNGKSQSISLRRARGNNALVFDLPVASLDNGVYDLRIITLADSVEIPIAEYLFEIVKK